MRRRLWHLLPVLALILLCLSGCGGAGQPKPTPTPSPAPVLEFPDGTAASVDAESLSDQDAINDMPVYPAAGSVKMIDGTVVVKFAD